MSFICTLLKELLALYVLERIVLLFDNIRLLNTASVFCEFLSLPQEINCDVLLKQLLFGLFSDSSFFEVFRFLCNKVLCLKLYFLHEDVQLFGSYALF